MRAAFNEDIAIGTIPLSDELHTGSELSGWGTSNSLPSPEPERHFLTRALAVNHMHYLSDEEHGPLSEAALLWDILTLSLVPRLHIG